MLSPRVCEPWGMDAPSTVPACRVLTISLSVAALAVVVLGDVSMGMRPRVIAATTMLDERLFVSQPCSVDTSLGSQYYCPLSRHPNDAGDGDGDGTMPCGRAVFDGFTTAHEARVLRDVAAQTTASFDPREGGMAVVHLESGTLKLSGGVVRNVYYPGPGASWDRVRIPRAHQELYKRVRARVVRQARQQFHRGLFETAKPFMYARLQRLTVVWWLASVHMCLLQLTHRCERVVATAKGAARYGRHAISSVCVLACAYCVWSSAERACGVTDAYYQQHVDKNLTECYDVSALLYLSDYGSEFEGTPLRACTHPADCGGLTLPALIWLYAGGRFVWYGDDGAADIVVEPRVGMLVVIGHAWWYDGGTPHVASCSGRLIMFSSGWDNLHRVERVTKGVRNALLTWLSCLPRNHPQHDTACASREWLARRAAAGEDASPLHVQHVADKRRMHPRREL